MNEKKKGTLSSMLLLDRSDMLSYCLTAVAGINKTIHNLFGRHTLETCLVYIIKKLLVMHRCFCTLLI